MFVVRACGCFPRLRMISLKSFQHAWLSVERINFISSLKTVARQTTGGNGRALKIHILSQCVVVCCELLKLKFLTKKEH